MNAEAGRCGRHLSAVRASPHRAESAASATESEITTTHRHPKGKTVPRAGACVWRNGAAQLLSATAQRDTHRGAGRSRGRHGGAADSAVPSSGGGSLPGLRKGQPCAVKITRARLRAAGARPERTNPACPDDRCCGPRPARVPRPGREHGRGNGSRRSRTVRAVAAWDTGRRRRARRRRADRRAPARRRRRRDGRVRRNQPDPARGPGSGGTAGAGDPVNRAFPRTSRTTSL